MSYDKKYVVLTHCDMYIHTFIGVCKHIVHVSNLQSTVAGKSGNCNLIGRVRCYDCMVIYT